MTISATGIWNNPRPPVQALPRASRGFTLIEVLVVILIIGIIINFVTLSLGGRSPTDSLKTEARRFTSLIELAAEEALLQSELIGIVVEEDNYPFLVREGESWAASEETVFRRRNLPEGIHFELITEQKAAREAKGDTPTPDIVLLSSGELTPFEIKVTTDLTDDFFRITGSETGALALDYVDAY